MTRAGSVGFSHHGFMEWLKVCSLPCAILTKVAAVALLRRSRGFVVVVLTEVPAGSSPLRLWPTRGARIRGSHVALR